MRPERTPAEAHAIEALKQALIAEGRTVIEDLGWTDRPDAVLEIDGRRVAVECRTFTSERLLRLHGLDMPDGRPHQIYIPFEPHSWISEAIGAKTSKVPDYLERTRADACWLVLHDARGMSFNLAETYRYEGAEEFFRMGACQPEHAFERVYLASEYAIPPFPPVCLFAETDAPDERARLKRARVVAVPANRYWFAQITATEGPDGQGQIAAALARRDQVRIVLQPLDKSLSIDYSEVLAVPPHETWNRADLSSVGGERRAAPSEPPAET